VHAQFIDESFEARLAKLPNSDPEKVRLQHLDDVLKSEIHAATNPYRPYDILKLNPDYLLDSRNLNAAISNYAGPDIGKIEAFCFASYADAVFHDPEAYARKVVGQFSHFLFPDPKTFVKDSVDLKREYQLSADSMHAHRPSALRPDVSEMDRRYETELAEEIAAVNPDRDLPVNTFGRWCARWALFVEALFLAALLAILFWPPLRSLRPGGWAALFLFLAPLGNAFGVCIVHALDIYRYRATYGGYLLFALTAMAAFALLVVVQSLSQIARKLTSRRT
jgi:hypothetical protein